MRMKLASVLLLTSTLGFGVAAMAAPSDTTGTIKSIDAKAISVTLDNGTVYMLPKTFKLADFKVGEKVSVHWELKGTAHDATAMTAAS